MNRREFSAVHSQLAGNQGRIGQLSSRDHPERGSALCAGYSPLRVIKQGPSWAVQWHRLILGSLAVAVLSLPSHVEAAEVKLLSSLNMTPIMKALVGKFEQTSGHSLSVTFDEAIPVRNRILAGEAADVIIDLKTLIDELEAKGKIVSGSAVTFARSTISIVVGPGETRPDISSRDALKRTLLAAKSITYGNPAGGGAAGMMISGVLQRLQIVDDIKAKVILEKDGPHVVALVAAGGAELGMTQTSIALSKPGLTYVGTLPRDVVGDQLWGAGAYAIGVVTGVKQPEAARAFVQFMSSPAAAAVLKEKGMEP